MVWSAGILDVDEFLGFVGHKAQDFMEQIILIGHIVIAIAIIAFVLMQQVGVVTLASFGSGTLDCIRFRWFRSFWVVLQQFLHFCYQSDSAIYASKRPWCR